MIPESILNNPKDFVTLHTDLTACILKRDYLLRLQSFTVMLLVWLPTDNNKNFRRALEITVIDWSDWLGKNNGL